jgi:hypothetical protein
VRPWECTSGVRPEAHLLIWERKELAIAGNIQLNCYTVCLLLWLKLVGSFQPAGRRLITWYYTAHSPQTMNCDGCTAGVVANLVQWRLARGRLAEHGFVNI